jgi:hypothetical protein
VRGILRGGVQCPFNDLSYLGVRDGSWPTCAIFVGQPVNAILHKPAAPLANRVLVDAKAFGNIFALQALRAQQNHPASIRQRPRRLVPTHLRFKKIPILVAQSDKVRLPADHQSHSCRCSRSQTK